MNPVKNFFTGGKNHFLKGSLVFVIFFLITRLPYLIYYPVNVLSNDTASYISAAVSILNSGTPLFDIRTPGYPVFLSLVWTFSESIFASSVIQIAFSFLTGILCIYIFSRIYSKYTFLFACFLTVYMTSSYFLILEPAVLTESLFTNSLLIFTLLMILSFKKDRNIYWILLSVSTAVVILIRPAGLFLAGTLILILIYFIFKKYSPSKFVSLVIPFAVIITGLCTYNYSTLNSFTITPFGEANLSGVTVLFMQTSDKYPEFVNNAIKQTLDSIPRKDRSYVKNNSSVSKLFNVFKDNFFRQMNFADNLMGNDSTKSYMDVKPYMRIVSEDAIKNNPRIYAKFFICNFYYFFRNLGIDMKYFDQLLYSYNKNVVERRYVSELDKQKWLQISSDRTVNMEVKEIIQNGINYQEQLKYIKVNENGKVTAESTYLRSLYNIYEKIYNVIFRSLVWYIAFFLMFLMSIYLLIKSKFTDKDAVIAFILFMMFLTKAVMVSMVESSLERYSYTVEFLVYFSVPFILILFENFKSMKSKKLNS
ncbi:MAG: glycosyltransferase family 39 protein [Bacteroidetes bacterium]|nr:glycosyltransferase family 39 protein [Bacteroidota bacterium]